MNANIIRDFGQTITEHELKKGLLKMNSALQFDAYARQGWYHPSVTTRQPIHYNNHPVGSMERGIIPEWNVWTVRTDKTGKKHKDRIHKVGWRYTIQTMINRRVPGINWEAASLALGVQNKCFRDPNEIVSMEDTGAPAMQIIREAM